MPELEIQVKKLDAETAMMGLSGFLEGPQQQHSRGHSLLRQEWAMTWSPF